MRSLLQSRSILHLAAIAVGILGGCGSMDVNVTGPEDTFNSGKKWCKFEADKAADEFTMDPNLPAILCWGNCSVVDPDCKSHEGSYFIGFPSVHGAYHVNLTAIDCTTECVGRGAKAGPGGGGMNPGVDPTPSQP